MPHWFWIVTVAKKKMEGILQNWAFKMVPQDPTGKLARTLVKLKGTEWAEELLNALKPTASCPPRVYGAPTNSQRGVSINTNC